MLFCMYWLPVPQTKLKCGEVCLWNSTEILGHDWPVEKAITDLPMRMKGNGKRTSGNSLSPFGGPEQGFPHCLADITEVKLHLQCRLLHRWLGDMSVWPDKVIHSTKIWFINWISLVNLPVSLEINPFLHLGHRQAHSWVRSLLIKIPANFSGPESCFMFAVFTFKIKVLMVLKMTQWNYQLTHSPLNRP